jgi:hypothetical protein
MFSEDVLDWKCSTHSVECPKEKEVIAFQKHLQSAVADGFLHKEMMKCRLKWLSQTFVITCDREFNAMAREGLKEHEFMRRFQNRIFEAPPSTLDACCHEPISHEKHAKEDMISLESLMHDRKFYLANPMFCYSGTPMAPMMSSYYFVLGIIGKVS